MKLRERSAGKMEAVYEIDDDDSELNFLKKRAGIYCEKTIGSLYKLYLKHNHFYEIVDEGRLFSNTFTVKNHGENSPNLEYLT